MPGLWPRNSHVALRHGPLKPPRSKYGLLAGSLASADKSSADQQELRRRSLVRASASTSKFSREYETELTSGAQILREPVTIRAICDEFSRIQEQGGAQGVF